MEVNRSIYQLYARNAAIYGVGFGNQKKSPLVDRPVKPMYIADPDFYWLSLDPPRCTGGDNAVCQ